MRTPRPTLYWSAGWLCLVGLIVLADVYVFRPPVGEAAAPRIAPDAQPAAGMLEISWLGPPHFAGARDGLWVQRMLEERFAVRLRPIFMDALGYQRKKPLMIAGGPVPDFIWEADPLGLQKAVQHGFIAEVPLELIARRMPTYYRELTEEAPIAWTYASVGGRNFGIPTMNRGGALPRPGVWRMDWLRNVGIERPPETLEEFGEALRRLTRNDPDGNGVADTYGMSGDISNWWWVAFSEIFGAFGVLPFDWQEVDGRIVWGGCRPEAREALALLRAWYAEGCIHPEFVTDSMLPGQSLDRKFHAGRIGYIYYRGEQWNLNPTLSGSFAFQFLNLQFVPILAARAGVAERLLAEIPAALLTYALSEELMAALRDLPQPLRARILESYDAALERDGLPPEDRAAQREWAAGQLGRVNATVSRWILQEGLQNRILFGELFEPNPDRPARTPLPERLDARQRYYLVLRDTVLAHALERLPPERHAAFSAHVAGLVADHLRAQGVAPPAGALDADTRRRLAALLADARRDALLPPAWDWLAGQGVISRAPPRTSFRALLVNHYARLQYHRLMEPVLVAAPFPQGPRGQRGARTWGKGGNILTFGGHVAGRPELAVRVLDMQEAMYANRELWRESLSGREGLHWEWSDPVLREQALSGIAMKPDYVDPETGAVVDLSAGLNGMRRLLTYDMSFFNLVGASRAFHEYYGGVSSRQFRETYQREEWGLENALGKSDVVPSAAQYLSDLRMRQQTVYAEIIRGSQPLEAFDRFVAEWHRRGGAILLDEANRMHEEQRRILERVRNHL